LIGSGDQAGAWGATTDSNLANILDTAIAGYQTVSVASSSQALTYISGPTSSSALNQSVYAMLRLTTSTAANFAIYAPPVSKTYIIYNNSGYTATIYNSTVIGNTTAAGSGIAISDGNRVMVFSDGTNFYDLQAQNLTGTLAIANGGTGQTTQQAAINALTGTQTANRVLRSNGTNATLSQVALATDVSGTLPIANGGTGVTTIADLGNLFYPVGSIYTNANVSTNPVTLLGFGTWEAFGAGRVMVGVDAGNPLFDTVRETGGSADTTLPIHDHAATFTGTVMDTHRHLLLGGGTSPGGGGGIGGGDWNTSSSANVRTDFVSAGTPAGSVAVASSGSSYTNTNYQPYITVYMWRRTA
jgi:hypothetical protein